MSELSKSDGQCRDHLAFKALHAVYHERDFRVRCNDVIIGMVRRALARCLGREDEPGGRCPACAAGFDYGDVWGELTRKAAGLDTGDEQPDAFGLLHDPVHKDVGRSRTAKASRKTGTGEEEP